MVPPSKPNISCTSRATEELGGSDCVYTRDLEVAEVRGIVQEDKVPQGRQGRGPAGDGRVPEAEQGGSGFVRKHEKSFSRKKKKMFY